MIGNYSLHNRNNLTWAVSGLELPPEEILLKTKLVFSRFSSFYEESKQFLVQTLGKFKILTESAEVPLTHERMMEIFNVLYPKVGITVHGICMGFAGVARHAILSAQLEEFNKKLHKLNGFLAACPEEK